MQGNSKENTRALENNRLALIVGLPLKLVTLILRLRPLAVVVPALTLRWTLALRSALGRSSIPTLLLLSSLVLLRRRTIVTLLLAAIVGWWTTELLTMRRTSYIALRWLSLISSRLRAAVEILTLVLLTLAGVATWAALVFFRL
jgi:hypothetical protein